MEKNVLNIKRAWLLGFAVFVLVSALAFSACSPKKAAGSSTTVTTMVPETTPAPSTQGTSVPPEGTTEVPTETTVAPTAEPTVPPTTEEPTEPPTTEAPTAPPTTEPEETWIPTEPPVTDPPETEPQPTEPPVTEPKPTEPEVKFEEVNENVYVNAHVGIHKGPGNEYKVLEVLDKGDELLRTGIGENGWSRVVYKSNTCYIKTKYLDKTKPAQEPAPTEPPEPTDNPYYAGDGKYYCPHCGKISGDGSKGTCLRYFMTGFDCPCCGAYVPAQVCHTCGKDD